MFLMVPHEDGFAHLSIKFCSFVDCNVFVSMYIVKYPIIVVGYHR